ncbi:MAG: citramalate synthase [Nitrososphaeria archaeon]
MSERIEILDTTLRDGAQMAGVSFTLSEKIEIARKLDEIGIDIIEGGWPASNPKDMEFFREIKKVSLSHSKIAAFGSTKKKGSSQDNNLETLVDAGTEYAVIFGKSWLLHVREVLKVTPEENLSLIGESIDFLKSHGIKVIYDAEHFFDGYKEDPEYALSTIRTAQDAGAGTIVLADTNGGTLPFELQRIFREVRGRINARLGIHAHNDSGVAVANSLVAVNEGAVHVQGTINGLGERTGNADLIQIIPALVLKMGKKALRTYDDLKKLRSLSLYVYNLLNMQPNPYQPYVGRYAFTHKGGVHIDAMIKNIRSYEHIDPELVGNERNFVISEQSGRSSILIYANELGLNLTKDNPAVITTLNMVKQIEKYGSIEGADGTVKLMLLKNIGAYVEKFRVLYWMANSREVNGRIEAEGEVIVRVGNDVYYERETGVGPVHAIDKALRKALVKVFPELSSVTLETYKVTVTEGDKKGTASYVRVLIQFSDGKSSWTTASVSDNVLLASINALCDGYNYKLAMMDLRKRA